MITPVEMIIEIVKFSAILYLVNVIVDRFMK
jgi:hypothetical protein